MPVERTWDDPALAVSSDSRRRARYRALQSRWREHELGLPPGEDPPGRPIGSLLPDHAPPDSQWLTSEISDFAEVQIPRIHAENGALQINRLRRNLLSSQPLCFNLLGGLATSPATASIFAELTGWDIARVTNVLVEHAPPKAKVLLGDKTAFDGYLQFDSSTGAPGFLAIETKYTEPFSTTEYDLPSYRDTTNRPDGWWGPNAAETARHRSLNQLWRNSMLAQLHEQTEPAAGTGHVVVVSARDDSTATKATSGIAQLMKDPKARLSHVLLEDIVSSAKHNTDLVDWASRFSRRYLDVDLAD